MKKRPPLKPARPIVKLTRSMMRPRKPKIMLRSGQILEALRHFEAVADLVSFAAEMPDIQGSEPVDKIDQERVQAAMNNFRDQLYELLKSLLLIERASFRGDSDISPEIITDGTGAQ
jgi:hypothetical protein